MIVINAQLTFENLANSLCKSSKENIVYFPVKKDKKERNISNFTSLGRKKPQPADSVKTLEEIEKIKKYFLDRKQRRNYCLFIIGITSGYRIGDLLRLKFKDFLNPDYSWKREIDLIEQKTKKRRKVLITEPIKKAINLHINEIGNYDPDDYIFRSQKGQNRPIDSSSTRRIFNDMAINLDLPYHCSTHFLRKTFAYWFIKTHKNDMTALGTLQDILNHSSTKMTLKYCGIEKERQEQMLSDLSNLW